MGYRRNSPNFLTNAIERNYRLNNPPAPPPSGAAANPAIGLLPAGNPMFNPLTGQPADYGVQQMPGAGFGKSLFGGASGPAQMYGMPQSTGKGAGQGAELLALMQRQLAQPGYGLGQFPGAGAMNSPAAFLPPGLGVGARMSAAPGLFGRVLGAAGRRVS